MEFYTIGFTQKTAEEFFGLLKAHQIDVVVDIRLRPTGQLSGFTKQNDLQYFLKALMDCEYIHLPNLAPTKDLLSKYRQDKNWSNYERHFLQLLRERQVLDHLDQAFFEDHRCCLLCSEPLPDRCHRRLVAEFLATQWQNVTIIHL